MPPPRSPLHAAGVVLLFTALYAAFFAPVLVTGRLLAPGDALHLSLPHLTAPRPLWSPALFGGYPVMADPQNLTWYPPAWLVRGHVGRFNAFVVAGYVLASGFSYGYVRRLTGSRLAAFVGGVTYGLSGFLIGHLGHTNVLHAAAWTPCLVWSLEELRRRVTVGWVLVLAAATACSVTAGHPQIAFYALLLGAAYALALGWRCPAGRWRFFGAALGGVALGLGLCGVLLLPLLELSGQSLRARLTFYDFAGYALPLRQLPQLIFPALFGGVVDWSGGTITHYFGRGGGPAEANPFVGLAPLALAGMGVLLFRRRGVARFWLAVAALALLLALGKETPLAALCYRLPFYNRFRIPSRHLMEFALAAAVLAGYGVAGLAALDAAARRRLARHALLVLGGVAAVALAVFAGVATTGYYTRDLPAGAAVNLSPAPWANAAVGGPVVVFVTSTVAFLAWARRPGPAAALLLCAAVVLDLSSYSWRCLWRTDTAAAGDLALPAVLGPLRDELARSGQRVAPLYPFGPPETALANRARLWGLPCALGYSPLALERYRELTGIDYIGFSSFHALKSDDRAFDLLGVKYVLAPPALLAAPTHPLLRDIPGNLAAARWRRVGDLNSIALFENRRALPRAWLASEVVALDRVATLRAVRSGRLPDGRPFDPARTALTAEPVPLRARPDPAARVAVAAASDERLEIRTRSAAPGFLVVADVDYPGWAATVNGLPARIVRTDHVLRGVRVPAGENVVTFEFRPLSYRAGAALSVAAAVVAAALLARAACRVRSARRPARSGPPQATGAAAPPADRHGWTGGSNPPPARDPARPAAAEAEASGFSLDGARSEW